MARARRAQRSRGTLAIPIVGALVLLLVGTLIILGVRRQADVSGSLLPQVSNSPTMTASPSPTPSSTSTPQKKRVDTRQERAGAAAALRSCRAKTKAAGEVLATAEEGMGSWRAHVQAQTDAKAGDISVAKMNRTFSRTQKAGEKDVDAYDEAVQHYRGVNGSCRAVANAPEAIAKRLRTCHERRRAQQAVLTAAKDGMGDWRRHLADMRRSEHGKIHNPQKKWLRTWRAAPKNIKAYEKAAKDFSAPRC